VAGLTVLVVTQSRYSAEALAAALERHPDVRVAGAASSPEDARRQARELQPAVALIDLRPAEGIPLAQEVRRICGSRIVGLGVRDDRELLGWAGAGVAGAATRNDSLAFVPEAITRIVDGSEAWSETATVILKQYALEVARIRRIAESRAYGLTSREAEVLELVAQGFSNKEVARLLRLEVHTVKNHVQHLFRKVGVHHREDLAGAAMRDHRPGSALIDPAEDRSRLTAEPRTVDA
jgi:two-component system nitrate/nitrite response regulator NarL